MRHSSRFGTRSFGGGSLIHEVRPPQRVGRGCAELHDRMMVGVRAGRLELDEIWGYVGKKQKRVQRHEISPYRAQGLPQAATQSRDTFRRPP